jgi:hypothetical protein
VEAVLVGSQISLHLSNDSALDAVLDFLWNKWERY